MNFIKHPTFIINLASRSERKAHILDQFSGKDNFDIRIVDAIKHQIGAIGLWNTIKRIILEAIDNNLEYVLICEDDHKFKDNYNPEILTNCIEEAKKLNADLLSGGISWFQDAVQVSDNFFRVKKFSGLQFTIIFEKFYQKILYVKDFGEHDAADYKISTLSNNKYFIHPFISVQKEFGYSDVTEKNNGSNRVEDLFENTEKNITSLKKVNHFYQNIVRITNCNLHTTDFKSIKIPTYIINLPERNERRNHILEQFRGKSEFDITIIEAVKHKVGAFGLWESIRKIVQIAIENDDDVIIICEDDHIFTKYYVRDIFIQNILEAHEQGCDVLNGGIGGFNHAVPITKHRFWVDHFWSTQFIVIYRKLFEIILNEPYDEKVTADDKLSEITCHKMILYPFISIQKDFGYSDVTKHNTEFIGKIDKLFFESAKRLESYI